MRLLIASDAARPQVNGVVTTLEKTVQCLTAAGDEVHLIGPDSFPWSLPVPGEPGLRLALPTAIGARIEAFSPDALHIATEGPIGLAARRWALRHDVRFTTSYHTRFPEYLEARWSIPVSLGYAYLRWFHGPSGAVMANTPSMMAMLADKGFSKLTLWGRGVDTDLFTPDGPRPDLPPGPIWLNVGRVSEEKNLEAFYRLDLPGHKVQVGAGPLLDTYRARYPDVLFVGMKRGEELASYYRAADCFVFPSVTDTFGLVMLEAIASGVPVAAMPSPGPSDVIQNGVTGIVDADLYRAATAAIALDRKGCRTWAIANGWDHATQQFKDNLIAM